MTGMRKRHIKFALELRDGEQARTMEDLQKYFDVNKIIGYYQDGRLLAWLEDRFYADEADEIKKLSGDEPDLAKRICQIFHIDKVLVDEAEDVETIAWRKERLERLKQVTAVQSILENVDLVAFNQDDLEEIVHEENTRVVYLCQNTFTFPSGILRKNNMKYIGVGKNVKVVIKSNEFVNFTEKGIVFENVKFDERYEGIISNFHKQHNKLEADSPSTIGSTIGKKIAESILTDICVGKIKYKRSEEKEESKVDLTEFIYLIQKSRMPFYVSDGSGFFSVPSCDFLYDKSLKSSDPKRHDILEDIDLLGQSERLICVLEIRHPLSCDGIAFTDQVMYVKGNVFIPYAVIKDVYVRGGSLNVITQNNKWVIDCEMFNPAAIKLFLLVAAGLSNLLTAEENRFMREIYPNKKLFA